jgi:hypothetical protein
LLVLLRGPPELAAFDCVPLPLLDGTYLHFGIDVHLRQGVNGDGRDSASVCDPRIARRRCLFPPLFEIHQVVFIDLILILWLVLWFVYIVGTVLGCYVDKLT